VVKIIQTAYKMPEFSSVFHRIPDMPLQNPRAARNPVCKKHWCSVS
jgi:hypothetical protein